MRLTYVFLALVLFILIMLVNGCYQLSATCYETTSTIGESPAHLHAWCYGQQYTKPQCNALEECHKHKFNEQDSITEPAGVGPHTHELRESSLLNY